MEPFFKRWVTPEGAARTSAVWCLKRKGPDDQNNRVWHSMNKDGEFAEVDLLDAQIAKTEVRAPFGGVIGLRYVSEGAYVTPQSEIASLQALSPMKLEFSVPELKTQ